MLFVMSWSSEGSSKFVVLAKQDGSMMMMMMIIIIIIIDRLCGLMVRVPGC
jgi:hypothetical protein